MKKKHNSTLLLLLILILNSNFIFGQNWILNTQNKIGLPYPMGHFKIAQYDLKDSLTLDQALNLAYQYGSGWRLPTREEFEQIRLNKEYIGNFTGEKYWVVDKINRDSINVMHLDSFTNELLKSDTLCHIRLVSFLQSTPTEVKGIPIRIKGLEIAQFDFNYPMSWDEANIECQKLGKGWRLPTSKEISKIPFSSSIPNGLNFNEYYWTSDVSNKSGKVNTIAGTFYVKGQVRAVRSRRFLFTSTQFVD